MSNLAVVLLAILGAYALIGLLVLIFLSRKVAALDHPMAGLLSTVDATGWLILLVELAVWPALLGFWLRADLNAPPKQSPGREPARTGKVGQRGIAISDLRPSGKVEIDGERLEAVAQNGFIEKDCCVEVVPADTFALTVRIVRN